MLLNLTEAGRRLGVDRMTVRDRIEKGLIAAKVDPATGYLLVDEDEIVRYVSNFPTYQPPRNSLLPRSTQTAAELR